MMDLVTVQGTMEVIMTIQMTSRMVLTILIMMLMMMMLFTMMKASVSASSGAAVALAVTLLDAARLPDGSLRVYFAQVLPTIIQNLMKAGNSIIAAIFNLIQECAGICAQPSELYYCVL
jgi:hypothetical protein